MSEQNTNELVRKIFEAYLENKNLRKTPERFA
ncbi:MAG: transcriptional repressor, partial [Pedobacter sp.]